MSHLSRIFGMNAHAHMRTTRVRARMSDHLENAGQVGHVGLNGRTKWTFGASRQEPRQAALPATSEPAADVQRKVEPE